jgi:23S rRNA (adenine1618-N6)-methyltransferase
MTTPGGEVEFITLQLNQSLILRTRVQWYTSLIGKLSTLHALLPLLSQHGITNLAITEFVQGTKTRRWGLAWSFCDRRPSLEAVRGCKALPKAQQPPATEVVWTVRDLKMDTVMDAVEREMDALDVAWRFKRSVGAGVGFAWEKCWARVMRRRKARKEENNDEEDDEDDEDREIEHAKLGFKISVHTGIDSDGVVVTVRWLKGIDAILFESFCGMLKRKLTSPPPS